MLSKMRKYIVLFLAFLFSLTLLGKTLPLNIWVKRGKEATLSIEKIEKGVIKFHIKLNFKNGGKYPLGWPLIRTKNFRPPLTMDYDAIEFEVFTRSPQELPYRALRMTFYNEKGKEVYTPTIPVKRDEWVKVSIPLSRIKGCRIKWFNIYIAERWYKNAGFQDGEEIEFLIKNIKLVKKKTVAHKLLIDDLEVYSRFDKEWSVSGGPEGAVFLEDKIRHSGKHSLRWQVKIDYSRGASSRYPVGWLFLRKSFYSPQDWSDYGSLEFYLYVPPNEEYKGLRWGIRCADTGKEPKWFAFSPEAIIPGKWNRVTMRLNGFTVKGSLDKVMSLVFYIAENWYKDGEGLNFYFDDFCLIPKGEMKGKERGSEPLRKAGKLLTPLSLYLNIEKPVVYPVYPLEFIYPNTDLTQRKPVKEFYLKAAKGEIFPLTFAILAGKEGIRDLKVEIRGLRNGISSDVRVVKVWEQASLHWEVFSPQDKILVPELLLKDDRIEIKDTRDEEGRYIPPSVLSYPFGTDIPAHTLKQIWINFSLPTQIPLRIYRGEVVLRAKRGLETLRIPLRIEVLPFSLPSPHRVYGIYYRWRVKATRPVWDWPEELFLKDLEEFKRTGFNSLSIYFDNLESTRRMMELIKKVGLGGPIVVVGGRKEGVAKEIMEFAKEKGIDLYFYGIDEPNNEERLKEHLKLSRMFHSLGAKVMVACIPSTAKILKEKEEGLDLANLASGGYIGTDIYLKRLKEGKEDRVSPLITIYWQDYEENPTCNRFFSGYYVWWRKIDGVFPYEYQGFPFSVAYSRDTRRVLSYLGKKNRIFRSWCVAYPSKEGPVSTLQWEGIRLGINDIRYLTYLEELLEKGKREGKNLLVEETEEKLKDILKPFSNLPPDPSVYTNPYKEPSSFQEVREKIVGLILELRKNLR